MGDGGKDKSKYPPQTELGVAVAVAAITVKLNRISAQNNVRTHPEC